MSFSSHTLFDPEVWRRVPFHFWSAMFFIFGCIVGSFLNVCIYRMPLGKSIVSPPSHCPHCNYSIPWYLNVPLVTWLMLRGKCKNCGAPIAVRYFLVELLTGITFLGCWLQFGPHAVVALIYCAIVAGLIVATFIDFEHFIIPDEITIGGAVAGVLCSMLAPSLHGETTWLGGLRDSAIGLAVGGGLIEAIRRGGKWFFGRHRVELEGETKIIFGETGIHFPDREVPYEEIFYRRSDTIVLHARTVELADRCYQNVVIRLAPERLVIDEEELDPEKVSYLEAVSADMVLPREVMGFGDVKFMAAIGAFLGWPAVLFSLMFSAIIGSAVSLPLVALGKRELSSRIPYGPYIAVAAAIWIFLPQHLQDSWLWNLRVLGSFFSGSPLPPRPG